jgi:hypothetical protein
VSSSTSISCAVARTSSARPSLRPAAGGTADGGAADGGAADGGAAFSGSWTDMAFP